MDIIHKLTAAHLHLLEAIDQSPDEQDSGEPDAFQLERGWVPFPLADGPVQELESLAGFTFSPLLRALFQTKYAMLSGFPGLFGVSDWVNGYALEKNRDLARARQEYDWELPKMVAITWDEDFLAVTEAGKVVRVCSNEGNVETRLGTLESWLTRYTAAVELYASDPDAYDRDEEEDEYRFEDENEDDGDDKDE